MPLKRNAEWAASRAAAYQRKAFLLNYQAYQKEIDECLKKHPEAIPRVREMLVQLKLLPPASANDPIQKPSLATVSEEENLLAKVGNEEVPLKFPSRVKFLYNPGRAGESAPRHVLMYILSQVEPRVFSHHALKALAPAARKQVPPQDLAILIEFVCDYATDVPLAPEHREVQAMIDTLKAAYVRCGEKAQYITLPPQLGAAGRVSVEVRPRDAIPRRYRAVPREGLRGRRPRGFLLAARHLPRDDHVGIELVERQGRAHQRAPSVELCALDGVFERTACPTNARERRRRVGARGI